MLEDYVVINVTVWNEYRHELRDKHVGEVYPEGIHGAIAGFLKNNEDFQVRTAYLDLPEHGLTDDVLNNTDVLIWWGHMAHAEVSDAIVEKVYDRVIEGMGMIFLHSAHASKLFQKLNGTKTGNLSWRDHGGELERLFTVNPGHRIMNGLPDYFEVPKTEMYGEYFDIAHGAELITISWFPGGEVFRSAFTFSRGKGRIFYLKPGHEEYPIYYQKEIQQMIINGIYYVAPNCQMTQVDYRVNIDLPKK